MDKNDDGTSHTGRKRITRAGTFAATGGFLACAIACSAPLLLSVSGSALVASGMATGFFARMEAIGLTIVGVGVLTLVVGWVLRLRAGSSPAAEEKASTSGCGCAAKAETAPSSNERTFAVGDATQGASVACTLDGQGSRSRALAFKRVFERAYLRSERVGQSVRWRFGDAPGLFEELTALAAQEHVCCSFFEFDIRAVGAEVWWETRSSAQAQPVLEEFFALPQTLQTSEGEELAPDQATSRKLSRLVVD
ncbi:MAG: hypothetical protein ACI9KE_006662 [Polyangiales bacterium]|jgi:hypothetical protein